MSSTTPALTTASAAGPFVLVGSENGITVIPTQTPLARLNYFDGKFLRAEDLTAEQRYLRSLVELSNRAGGHGIAHGFDVIQRALGELEISPGLAIDPEGRVLLLPAATTVSLTDLIDKTRQALSVSSSVAGFASATFGDCVPAQETPPTQVVDGGDLYLITIAHAEALCGQEDVYGKLCEEACITSTDRPFRIEGIVLRARPLLMSVPLPTSGIGLSLTHWRSRVASAYFEDERRRVASLISKSGLESDVWCHGAVPATGSEIPIAVVGRVGTGIHFLDLWTVRRERIDTPARRYWQWRMAMRPWDVFLAHVLQFQCQLNSALGQVPPPDNPDDPCREAQSLVDEAQRHFQTLKAFYLETTQRLAKLPKTIRDRALPENTLSKSSLSKLEDFASRLTKASDAFKALPTDRLLIQGGIIELPSAGYLPVVPGTTLTVNEQVRRLLGEGVDLRFCICRPDYVAHALEEAQHLERISLVTGIDNPSQKQEVDILVPYGQVASDRIELGRFYEMRLNVNLANLVILAAAYSTLHSRGTTTETGTPTGDGAAAGPDANATAPSTDAARVVALVAQYLKSLERDAKGALVLEYVTGAARSDAPADGSLAFCYAGTTNAFQWGNVLGDAPADTTNPNADSLAGGAASIPGSFLGGRRLRAVAGRQIEARSSIWITLDLGSDPASMAIGASTTARAECYLLITTRSKGAPSERDRADEGIFHLSFLGELQVEDSDVRTGTREVREIKAALAGQLTFSTVTSGEEREAGSVHLTESVTLVRTEDTFGPSYTIVLPDPSILQPLVGELEVRRSWESTTEAGVTGTIGFRALRQRDEVINANIRRTSMVSHLGWSARQVAIQEWLRQIFASARVVTRQAFRAWQTIRPEVLDPTHPAHESAIRAVRGIGTALGSSKFADLAAKRLFPAPPAETSTLSVLATLDWVLFHRRRDKQCHLERPKPQVQTRAYALYQVALAANAQVSDLAKAMIKGGADLARFELNFVQVIEYGAGVHSVVSPHSQVRAGWRQDVGSDAGQIEGGVIASRGLAAAEGERLAGERLEAVVEVVAPINPPVLQPAYVVQMRVPDGYDVPGNDGLVVIATRVALDSNCHTVIAVDSAQWLGELTQAATAGRLAEALSKLRHDLGVLIFTGNIPDSAGLTAMRTAWDALGFGSASGALVVSVAGDADVATYPPQAAALLTGLGGSGEPIPAVAPQATGLGDCPAVTIIAGSVVRRQALLLYTAWDNGQHFIVAGAPTPSSPMEFRNDVPQGNALANFLSGLGPNQPIRGVTVTTTAATPDAGAVTRLQAVLQALVDDNRNVPAPHRQVTEPLSTHDRSQLTNAGISFAGFDDVIFFEINDG